MPECRYRASSLVYKRGFPLKACGNDSKKLCFHSVFSIGEKDGFIFRQPTKQQTAFVAYRKNHPLRVDWALSYSRRRGRPLRLCFKSVRATFITHGS